MKTKGLILALVLLLTGRDALATGYGDTQPRAMGIAGAYGAMARGAESIYWNPANLALSDGPRLSLPGVGMSFILENNSISISDYNKYNGDFISDSDKSDILNDIDAGGLKFNTDGDVFIPILGGIAFPLPGGLSSAIAINVRGGVEGEVPRDMIDLLLNGNQFARDREADGKSPGYDIAEWDGQGWGMGVFSWAIAKPLMPAALSSYLSEFAVGATFKVMLGGFGEVLRSDGGIQTRISGTDIGAHAITRFGGGTGFGLDLGVTGVTKDGKTTAGLALINLLDTMNWGIASQQDSVFVQASRLRALSFTGKAGLDEIFDNPVDENGETVFHEKVSEESFSLTLPAMLRLGVTHTPISKLTVSGQFDQAFSSGFGIASTPRLALGVEYRLVDWFPLSFGLSGGGRAGQSSAIGFGFGPFPVGSWRLTLMETGLVNRGGFLPGVAQGAGWSINLLRASLNRM
ncbi:MAG: DUF5723 family protein [Candidatus Latescibacterota bacterium]